MHSPCSGQCVDHEVNGLSREDDTIYKIKTPRGLQVDCNQLYACGKRVTPLKHEQQPLWHMLPLPEIAEHKAAECHLETTLRCVDPTAANAAQIGGAKTKCALNRRQLATLPAGSHWCHRASRITLLYSVS